MIYAAVKHTHELFALLTITGFLLRGFWLLTDSPWLKKRVTRIAPHIIDTVFLASGIALVFQLHLALSSSGWLLAKLAGLVVYIVFGMVALRFGRSRQVQVLAFVGAVATFAYIVGVAFSKNTASWLALTS